jgi:hypothetical protein
MKRILIASSLVGTLLGFTPLLGAGPTKLGDGVSLETATPIATLLDRAQEYLGRTVRVDGTVTGVCGHEGCWMELQDEDSGRSIRLKVEDGEIVFPVTAKGRQASAEGTLERVAPKKDEYRIRATGALLR